jgi:hypothetical protein
MLRVIGSWLVRVFSLVLLLGAGPVNSDTFNVEANFDLTTLEPTKVFIT